MPVTKGSGNPDWTYDETILALDLLYRRGKPIDARNSDVVELSELLRSASIHPVETRKPSFRNPDGVALKLQNLWSAIEEGKGLSSSKTDKRVVAEFPKTRAAELSALAALIRRDLRFLESPPDSPDEETFTEGGVATAAHRKRDGRLRKKLLATRKDGDLFCAICEFRPPVIDRVLRESFFETHHKVPLAEAKEPKKTRVSDLVLLCAGCHRFLHKLIVKNRRWMGVEDARAALRTTVGE